MATTTQPEIHAWLPVGSAARLFGNEGASRWRYSSVSALATARNPPFLAVVMIGLPQDDGRLT